MKQRLAGLALVIGFAAGGLAGHASADTSTVEDLRPVTTQAERYWACVALDHVHVGACVENPLPDPQGWGSVRTVVHDLTGRRAPV